MMRTRRVYALSLSLLALVGVSCDRVTAPAITGGVDVVIDATSLDAIRVTVSGTTSKTVTQSATGGVIHLDGLTAGTYAITVEGLVDDQVARYGEGSVFVNAGYTSEMNVPLSLFQPVVSAIADTVKVLHFTVEYSAVPHATSYIIEWSKSHTLAEVSSDTVTGTSAEIVVPDEGRYYFVVRAANTTVAAGGMASDMGSVYALQAVATVTVVPATPSIVDGETQQFAAIARDADNNILTGITLFWASSNNAVATVSQTGLVTSLSSGQVTISAVAKGVPGNAVLTITPQTATKLAFTSQPTSAVAGQAISGIKVAIQNPKNQVLTSDNSTQVTLAIAANPGGGVMSGTAVATAVNGVASFDNISINRTGTNYTLTATATSLASGVSAQFSITPAAASQLVFTTQPSNATAGVSFGSIVEVEVRDALGNRVTAARDAVTLTFGANPGAGTISGTRIVNAVSGVASFPGISVDKAATGYTLSADMAGLPSPTSVPFNITAAAVAKIVFTAQPVTVTADADVEANVTAMDAFDNLVSTPIDVTVAFANNPGGGTLGGTTTVQTSGGIASFTDLQVHQVGSGYTLVATAGALSSLSSTAFNVTPGAPAMLSFLAPINTTEPQDTLDVVQVAVVDQHGNQTEVDGTTVDIAIAANPSAGTLTGTVQQLTVDGVATFADLSIDLSGEGYSLLATNPGPLAGDTSEPFDMSAEFVDYVMGFQHTCGLTTTGKVYCAGSNSAGQLGNGGGSASSRPTRVLTSETFVSIAAGSGFTCAIRSSDHQAMCWGQGVNGKLGNGGVANALVPGLVSGGETYASISAGGQHACGIRESDLRVLCWGAQANGRLGNNTLVAGDVTAPVLTADAAPYVAVTAGSSHSCGIRASDLRVLCWGFAGNGRLGNGLTIPDVGVPSLTTNTSAFVAISAGGHTCGIRSDSRAMCWGAGTSGQLGDGLGIEQPNPVAVVGGLRFASISAGGSETCGTLVGGEAFCWGNQANGRLGNGSDLGGSVLAPAPVLGNHLFVSPIHGNINGNAAFCGATAEGAYCWGFNGNGQLGNGNNAQISVPVKVLGSH